MSKVLVTESYLEDIANSIRAKNGTQNTYTPSQMSTAIDNIPTGGSGDDNPTVELNEINFFDYDGTLLYSYSIAEANQLESLPTPPIHDGLTSLGWNYELVDVVGTNMPLNIAARYTTPNDSLRVYIDITEDFPLDIAVQFVLNGTVEIDWGDNTQPEQLTANQSLTAIPTYIRHSYINYGKYVITLKMLSGTISGGYTNYPFLNSQNKNRSHQLSSMNKMIYKIEIGNIPVEYSVFNMFICNGAKNIIINSFNNISPSPERISNFTYSDFAFFAFPKNTKSNVSTTKCMISGCNLLKRISIPKGYSVIGSINECRGLEEVVLPPDITTIEDNGFLNDYSLKRVVLNHGLQTIGTKAFNGCPYLHKINLPNSLISIGTNAFNGCLGLVYLTIPNSIRTFGANAFYDCKSMEEYDFTSWSISDLQATTFNSNVFGDATRYGTTIKFATQEIAEYAKTVTNLTQLSGCITYEGAE